MQKKEIMQLNVRAFVDRAGTYFPRNELVTLQTDGSKHRYTYGDMVPRVRQLTSALASLGVKQSDRLATFAWNTYQHYELYFGIPCSGAVVHTVNLRLADEHIIYILNHAEDKLVFVDPELIEQMERIAPQLKTVEGYIVLSDKIPPTSLSPVYSYEELLRSGNAEYVFPVIDENLPAGMCYTSATTGNPKGVLYSHRDLYLHASLICFSDGVGVRESDTFLPMVPMFHANAWGLPHAATWMGAQMVLPGPRPTSNNLLQLIQDEKVTWFAAAVSVGIDCVNILKEQDYDLSSLRSIMLGGSATPKSVMDFFWERWQVPVYTAWGSTEMAPLATQQHIKRHQQGFSHDKKTDIRVRQGLACPGAEIKVIDENGAEVPWDDATIGEVYSRAPWSATTYYNDARSAEGFQDGWWKSGDMATINEEGVLKLVDRAKDLIKSGGEWISSVDLENALVAHEQVKEAAVVAKPDEKWLERPIAYVCLHPGAKVTEAALIEFIAPSFAKWWLPDEIRFLDEIPKTGVGKINKKLLREKAESAA